VCVRVFVWHPSQQQQQQQQQQRLFILFVVFLFLSFFLQGGSLSFTLQHVLLISYSISSPHHRSSRSGINTTLCPFPPAPVFTLKHHYTKQAPSHLNGLEAAVHQVLALDSPSHLDGLEAAVHQVLALDSPSLTWMGLRPLSTRSWHLTHPLT
jgi:hypothetical protein